VLAGEPATVLLQTEPVKSSVVWDLLALAVAGPYTTTDCSRDTDTKTNRCAYDEESDDDLSP